MPEDLIGKVFTRLTVLGRESTRGKNSYLKCSCSCGTIKSVRRDSLLNGDVKSCGCLSEEIKASYEAAQQQRRVREKLIKELNRVYLQGKDMAKCEHERERSRCRDCGGSSYCEHDRVRQTCSVCSPEKVFAMYEYRARQRKLLFLLTLDQFSKLVQKCCAYCGECESPRGIDRIENSKGYTTDNSLPCCGPCNFLKRTMGQREFLALVHKIAEHQRRLKEVKEAKRVLPSPEITKPEPIAEPTPSPLPNLGFDPHLSPEARRFLDNGF
jgi:hypothetical protein